MRSDSHPAQTALDHVALERLDHARIENLKAHRALLAARIPRGNDLVHLGQRARDRLFQKDVIARLQRLDGHRGVIVDRRRQHDHVDLALAAGQHRAIVVIDAHATPSSSSAISG